MNPTALIAVAALLLLSIASVIILRLVRKGRAKSAGDLVKIARERSAAAKESKAATKRAEAAIAEPVTASRLSRISNRRLEEPDEAMPAMAEAEDLDFDVTPLPQVDGKMADGEAPEFPEDAEAHAQLGDDDVADDEPLFAQPDDALASDEELDAENRVEPLTDAEADDFAAAKEPAVPEAFDLADPDNHPQDWDMLVAMIECLDAALARPWPEDELGSGVRAQLAAARAAASEDADGDLAVIALGRDAAAIDLARTINSASREQAAEIVAVVREFAYNSPFNPDDCAAVMAGLKAIEWMALIPSDRGLRKRTLPLTRHDPEAPLWVAEALAAMDSARLRQAS